MRADLLSGGVGHPGPRVTVVRRGCPLVFPVSLLRPIVRLSYSTDFRQDLGYHRVARLHDGGRMVVRYVAFKVDARSVLWYGSKHVVVFLKLLIQLLPI